MTGNGPNESVGPESGPRPSSEDAAQALRLRAERPRITRLSRKVLAGATAFASLLISGAVLWALRSNHTHNPAPDDNVARSQRMILRQNHQNALAPKRHLLAIRAAHLARNDENIQCPVPECSCQTSARSLDRGKSDLRESLLKIE